MTAVLLAGCTSISITETKDEKGNAIAAVKVSATAVGYVDVFATKMAKRISSVCAALRERDVALAAAKAKADAAKAKADAAKAEADAAKAKADAAKADAAKAEADAAKAKKKAAKAKKEAAEAAAREEVAKNQQIAAMVSAQAAADATPPRVVVDLQSVLGLLNTARALLPVHEYVRTCLLQSAETQGPKAYKSPRHSPQRHSDL